MYSNSCICIRYCRAKWICRCLFIAFVQLAFKYLGWVLFPLFISYGVYSLVYQEHKGWYSFVLGMCYGFLLTFGETSFMHFAAHSVHVRACVCVCLHTYIHTYMCKTSSANISHSVGFITMTPQLFINYKLKSVAHLPWRMLTYKALNTFIDDMFAFVIKMPMMYRIGCFRDGEITAHNIELGIQWNTRHSSQT